MYRSVVSSWMTSIPLCGYTIVFIHSQVCGYLDCFQLLVIMIKAAKTFAHRFYVDIPLHFSWANRSGIAGLYSNSIRHCKTFFMRLCYLQSHQQCMRVPGAMHSCQHLVLLDFFFLFFFNLGHSNRCIVDECPF